MPSKYARKTLAETPLEIKEQAIKYGEMIMKTQQEIEEIAEREYKSIDKPLRSGKDMHSYILGFIKGYQAAQDMKWIDCKDRLPEKVFTETSDRVLVWQKNKIYISAYNHFQNFWETNYEDKITHWMPLPQKPLKP